MVVNDPTKPGNTAVNTFFGGDIKLNIPFLTQLTTPTSLLTWIIAILAIMPWIIWIVCIFVILINVIKWVKSNGNEKEVESAKSGIKKAVVGFLSMFVLFILANLMSSFFVGTSFESLIGALAPCRIVDQSMYVFEFSRAKKITIEEAYKQCVTNKQVFIPIVGR